MPDPNNGGMMYDPQDYLNAQRAQMLAQALAQYSMTPSAPTNSGPMTSRASPLSAIARMLGAKMSANAANTAGQDYQKVYGNMANAGSQAIQSASNPQGSFADRTQATNFLGRYGLADPEVVKGLVAQTAAENKPADIDATLRGAGILPGTPEYQQIHAMLANKQTITDIRPGNVAAQAPTTVGGAPTPVYSAPQTNGVQTNFQQGQPPSQSNVTGSLAANAAASAATTRGSTSEGLVKVGTAPDGSDIYRKGSQLTGQPVLPPQGAPPGAPASAPPKPAGSLFMSPAQRQAQTSGAEAGQTFSTELAREAKGATASRRSISEIVSLSKNAPPSVANDAKLKLGGLLIAAGNDPANVSKALGTDVDSLTAASKQVAALAVSSIHAMTSRGTNFDLSTFMRRNPNLDMASPGGLARVAQWLDSNFKDSVEMQKEFNEYRKNNKDHPEDWESDFTSHWLDKQNQAIDRGATNSTAPAARPTTKQVGGKTYYAHPDKPGIWFDGPP